MLLPEEKSSKMIRRTFSIDLPTSAELDLYAKALGASPNWVVCQALAFVFAKDKEFQTWKEANPDVVNAPEQTRKPRVKRDKTSEKLAE